MVFIVSIQFYSLNEAFKLQMTNTLVIYGQECLAFKSHNFRLYKNGKRVYNL